MTVSKIQHAPVRLHAPSGAKVHRAFPGGQNTVDLVKYPS